MNKINQFFFHKYVKIQIVLLIVRIRVYYIDYGLLNYITDSHADSHKAKLAFMITPIYICLNILLTR